jgi:hypothetical protein
MPDRQYLQVLFNVAVDQPPELVLWPGPPDKGSAYHNDPKPRACYSPIYLPGNAVSDLKRKLVVPDRHAQAVLRSVADENVILLGHSYGPSGIAFD